jgi:alanine-synthesizing transaminase
MDFPRIKRLPPYVFNIVGDLCLRARRAGEDIIDFGMGNPDEATPPHIVQKLVEAASKPANHRYSVSRGVYKLRLAICGWYRRRYGVELDPDSEAIVTIGSKEGIAHMALAILDQGDVVLAPTPTYPIHQYGCIIAGAQVQGVPLRASGEEFFDELTAIVSRTWPRPKFLIMNFPHNPTTATVDMRFMKRIVEFARESGIMVAHDFAYADLCFDGYKAPSMLQVTGAREIGVEFFTLSKSYNMPGWRVGFAVGNREMIGALSRLKSYFDYGIFTPVQVAAIAALNGPQECVGEIVETYRRRRNSLVDGLNRAGWAVEKPRATMFVWAPIPEPFRAMGSLEFAKFLLAEAKVAVSPGVGFGADGDGFVRFALIENEHRTRQALRGIRHALAQAPRSHQPRAASAS